MSGTYAASAHIAGIIAMMSTGPYELSELGIEYMLQLFHTVDDIDYSDMPVDIRKYFYAWRLCINKNLWDDLTNI